MSPASADLLKHPRLRAGALRLALLAACWWVLSEGEGSWAFGLPVVIGITLLSLRLHPAADFRINPLQLPPFLIFFLGQSLRAGWDVARRTLHPAMPLQPAIICLPLSLPPGAPTWLLLITLNLLPGTLGVRLDRRRHQLELHCLDARLDIRADVAQAEARLSRLFVRTPTASGKGGKS